MTDMELDFDPGDSNKTGFWLGKQYGNVHLWQENEQTFSVSITIGAEEIFVLKVLNNCSKIQITKDKREEL